MPKKSNEKTKEVNMDVAKKEEKSSVTKGKATSTSKSEKTNRKSTSKDSKTTKKTTTIAKTSKTKDIEKKNSTVTKKPAKTKNSTKNIKQPIVEYYDLPFRYNQTVVKILAQTPNTLFVYWDISDEDRKSYIDQYGEDFFNNTTPILKVTNETMNYTFEVDINDFANSWYLHINDASCKYKIELGRRAFYTNYENNYIYIASSNNIEAPNNRILFDNLGHTVFFKNIKTNFVEEKNVSSISYLQKVGKIYNIYDLYKQIYKEELNIDENNLNLPSSSSSSTFK